MSLLRVGLVATVLGGTAIAGFARSEDATPVNAAPSIAVTPEPGSANATDAHFVTIENQDETMTLQVPATWVDVSQGRWTYHGVKVGYFLTASTNLSDFRAGRAAPGVFMGVFSGHAKRSISGLLDTEKIDAGKRCTATGRTTYTDQFYIGNIDTYVQCGGSGQRSLVSVVQSGDGSTVLLRVNVQSDVDIAVATKIFASFQVLGNVDEHDHGHAD